MVNNVIYSPIWDYVISFSDRWAPVRANVVGNYKIEGKKRQSTTTSFTCFPDGGKGFSIFLSGNVDETLSS